MACASLRGKDCVMEDSATLSPASFPLASLPASRPLSCGPKWTRLLAHRARASIISRTPTAGLGSMTITPGLAQGTWRMGRLQRGTKAIQSINWSNGSGSLKWRHASSSWRSACEIHLQCATVDTPCVSALSAPARLRRATRQRPHTCLCPQIVPQSQDCGAVGGQGLDWGCR